MNPNQPKRPNTDFSMKPAMERFRRMADAPTIPKQPQVQVAKRAKRKKLPVKYLAIVLGFLVVAGLPSLYFYNKSQQAEKRLNNPNTASKEVIDEVVSKAGRHVLLPSGEQPTLATVSDVSKVKGQPFFQNAENGDKVLVYTQARKAYLYRPSKDIIIEVAPLNVDSLQSTKAAQ